MKLFSIRYLFFIAVVVLIATPSFSFAQDSLQSILSHRLERADVQWEGQWPAAKPEKRTFWEFISGKKKLRLTRPISMVVPSTESFWILDQEANAILQVKKGVGKFPHFIESSGHIFSSLVGICEFTDGKYLVTDSYLNHVFLIDPANKKISVLNDSLKLTKPTGVAYNRLTRQIWVLETGEHRIDVLDENGNLLKQIGSRGKEKGEFNFPTHICIDKDGNAYVVDAMNFRVQVFNKDGNLLSVFGSNGDGTGYFASPKGIAVDSYGHIYIADALFHAIQIFDIKGNFLYAFGEQGQGEGEFWMPNGVYIDSKNKIYIADSYNSRIQIFQLISGGTK